MGDSSHPVYKILDRLEAAKIHYRLDRFRPETIMILVTVPGRRYEIEVFQDGHLEVAYFTGTEGVVGGTEIVDELIRDYSD